MHVGAGEYRVPRTESRLPMIECQRLMDKVPYGYNILLVIDLSSLAKMPGPILIQARNACHCVRVVPQSMSYHRTPYVMINRTCSALLFAVPHRIGMRGLPHQAARSAEVL